VEQQEIAPWVNSLVTAVREICACFDSEDLTSTIKKEHHQLPMVEEIITSGKMTGTKYFSLFTARNGFWQVKLDKHGAELCIFNTPWG
jgi:hypothetical protein